MSEQPGVIIFQNHIANITLVQFESLRVKEAQGREGLLLHLP
jgi:hypothetical protein